VPISRSRIRLRYKIIIWSFVPTAIILLMVAITNYLAYQQVTEELVIGRDRELVRLSASEISASFEDYIDSLNTVSRQPGIYIGNPILQREAFRVSTDHFALFDAGGYLLDNLGRVVAAHPANPNLIGQDWSGRSFFSTMVRNPGLFFSDGVSEGSDGENVISIAVPVLGEQGEFRGVLVGMFSLDSARGSSFFGNLLKLRIGQLGQTYLLDGNQKIIYASDSTQIGEDAGLPQIAGQIEFGSVGALRTRSVDGRDILAGYAPVPRTSWTLLIQQEWADLIQPTQGYRQFLIVLLVMGVVVPTIVVLFGVQRITGPIADFTAAARRIAGGDFSQPIQVTTKDELEELAVQFNTMAGQLKESYETLESRVEQRTQELTALNSVASAVNQSLDFEQILQDALDKTIEVMNMHAGGIFRLDEDTKQLVLVGHSNINEQLFTMAQKLPLASSIISEVVHTKQPASRLVENYPPGRLRSALAAGGWKTVVSIPLLFQDKVLGAMNILSSEEVHLSAEQLVVPASIGQQVGVAMDNARLYKQTVEYARQMEEAHRTAEQARHAAEAANAAKSDFLANISHELRTPLVSIFGFARLVKKRLDEKIFSQVSPADHKLRRVASQIDNNLEIILSESQRLTNLINSLLDLEKIESGKMEWEIKPVECAEVIYKAAAATAPLFESGTLKLVVDVPQQVAVVNVDEDKLIQVVINLLSNAAKFTNHGTVSISAQRQDHEVIVSVTDDGPGIDPANQPRLFEKFVQVGDTLTGKPQGTGLGLAISKEIIDRHGGRIWVQSKPGQGSVFSFAIPVFEPVNMVQEHGSPQGSLEADL
jgi:signal transduction histidine kinase